MCDVLAVLQALADDPLTRYLAPSTDETARRLGVTEYAQGILSSASSAELLFQVSNFAAAALSHRIPEELVSIDAVGLYAHQASNLSVELDKEAQCHAAFATMLNAEGICICLQRTVMYPQPLPSSSPHHCTFA